jgi:hypothetical protein
VPACRSSGIGARDADTSEAPLAATPWLPGSPLVFGGGAACRTGDLVAGGLGSPGARPRRAAPGAASPSSSRGAPAPGPGPGASRSPAAPLSAPPRFGPAPGPGRSLCAGARPRPGPPLLPADAHSYPAPAPDLLVAKAWRRSEIACRLGYPGSPFERPIGPGEADGAGLPAGTVTHGARRRRRPEISIPGPTQTQSPGEAEP